MSTHLPKARERPPAPPGHFDPPQRTYAPAIRPRRFGSCYGCGANRWWRNEGGVERCAVCHPPPIGIPAFAKRPPRTLPAAPRQVQEGE